MVLLRLICFHLPIRSHLLDGAFFQKRNQHRSRTAVIAVLVAKLRDEVALLQLYGCQDITRSGERKQQVRHRHQRSSPECDDKTQIERVAHCFVKKRGAKRQVRVLFALKMQPHLAQPKQIKVVDQKCAEEHNGPTEQVSRHEHALNHRAFDRPHHAAHRLPQAHHQHEAQAGKQDEGAALDGFGHELRPPTFERRACHDAVLECEQQQKTSVGQEGLEQRDLGCAVNGFGHNQVADKTDGVQNGAKKAQVRDNAVEQKDCFFHKEEKIEW